MHLLVWAQHAERDPGYEPAKLIPNKLKQKEPALLQVKIANEI